jgi:hypothetical protein
MAEVPAQNPETSQGMNFEEKADGLVKNTMQEYSNLIFAVNEGRSIPFETVKAMGGNLSKEQEDRYESLMKAVKGEKQKVKLTEEEIAVFDRILHHPSDFVSEADYKVLESYEKKVKAIDSNLADRGFSKTERMG